MKKFILIDFLNLAHRSKHITNGDIDLKVGMGMSIIFNSIKSLYKQFNADHVVIVTDGKSWRKEFYPKYKRNRVEKNLEKSLAEIEEDKIFYAAFDEALQFFKEKTNVTFLHTPVTEADDLISFWINYHPNDEHIIVSTDSDYEQLLAENVKIYNGIDETFTTLTGYFDKKGNPKVDKKTKEVLIPNPEYSLFYKCIRGDKSDNIFSAYPGAREKSTKNKIGIMEAFNDRNKKGYSWNNFMLQRWVDVNDEEIRVIEAYERNKKLIDLTEQPDNIKEIGKKCIEEAIARDKISGVGVNFLKFCTIYNLKRLSDSPNEMAKILNKHYKDE